jgi:hypothetical protein
MFDEYHHHHRRRHQYHPYNLKHDYQPHCCYFSTILKKKLFLKTV